MKNFKKFVNLLIVSAMAFSTAVTVSAADNVTLIDPVDANIAFPTAKLGISGAEDSNIASVTNIYTDSGENVKVTGRTINVTNQSGIVYFGDRLLYNAYYYSNSQNKYVCDANNYNFKSNFTWEFDFELDTLPQKDKQFIIEMGKYGDSNSWKNAMKFQLVNDNNYYLVWGSTGTNDSVFISNPIISNTVAPTNDEKKYLLKTDTTYHLKLEADLEKTGKLYVTFTNPTIDSDGNPLTDGATPYTRTTVAPLALPVTTDVSTFTTNTWNDTTRANIKVYSKGPITINMSNESFKMDRFRTGVPTMEITGENNDQIKASAQFANITKTTLYCNAPTLICAAYSEDNKMVRMNSVNLLSDTDSSNKMNALTLNSYSTTLYDMSTLANGTYTVKAFMWNKMLGDDSLKMYGDAYAEKTITVTDGVVSVVDDFENTDETV